MLYDKNDSENVLFDVKIKIVKYVGILIGSKLNWDFHIDNLSTKLSRASGMLGKVRYYVNQKVLISIYHGIFASLLSYGCQIWGQNNNIHLKMKKLQDKAIRIINFKPLCYPVNTLYKNCEILKFKDNIDLLNCLYAHDNINSYLPKTLFNKLALARNIHSHRTRHSEIDQIFIPIVRTTSSGLNSIRNRSALTWNYFNRTIRNQTLNLKGIR